MRDLCDIFRAFRKPRPLMLRPGRRPRTRMGEDGTRFAAYLRKSNQVSDFTSVLIRAQLWDRGGSTPMTQDARNV